MSDDDVYPFEMDGSQPLDDAAAEALLRGAGRDVDPALADLVGDMRVAYTSNPPVAGAALAAFLTTGSESPNPASRRFERMKSSLLAKAGAATAVVFAATGGLAMASALPAPVQDAVSHLGVGAPAHHSHSHSTGIEAEETTTSTSTDTTTASTTVPVGVTTTTVERNHGDDVADVAHEAFDDGCEHGHAVAAVASRGKSQGQPCPTTTTTVAGGTTPSTVPDDQGDNENEHGDETTTTVAGSTTTMPGQASQGLANAGDHGRSGDHGGHGG